MDKLRAMRLFCRVVETGSFAAAAQALDLVPSAVSKTVAGLEQELGFALMNRSTRGVTLTQAGVEYQAQCRQILQQIEEAEAAGRDNLKLRGTVRIGMHPGLRHAVLTRLGSFLRQHEGLALETVINNSPSAVVSEGLDLMLHVGRLPDSSLVARQLAWTSTVVCASTEYLATRGEPRHPDELEGHAAVIYARRDEDPNTRWVFIRGAERCEVQVSPQTVCRDGIGVVDAVMGGCGIGRPLEISARSAIAGGAVHPLLTDWEGERHAISAVFPTRERAAVPKIRQLVDYVAAVLSA